MCSSLCKCVTSSPFCKWELLEGRAHGTITFVSNALEIKTIKISKWLVEQIGDFGKTFSISAILQMSKKAPGQKWFHQTPTPVLCSLTLFSLSLVSRSVQLRQLLINEFTQTRLGSSLQMSHLAAVYTMRNTALRYVHFLLQGSLHTANTLMSFSLCSSFHNHNTA